MTSPFTNFQNSTIVFTVSDGTSTTNSTGNRKFGNKEITLKTYLNAATSSEVERYTKEIQTFAGVDSYAALLKGYLVEPMVYPVDLSFLLEPGEITLSIASNKTEKGKFKLLPVIQKAALSSLEIEIVTPILGIFRRE